MVSPSGQERIIDNPRMGHRHKFQPITITGWVVAGCKALIDSHFVIIVIIC